MSDTTRLYKALSWDRLHAYHLGLFGDHLWTQFKLIVNSSIFTNEDRGRIDEGYVVVYNICIIFS